MTPDEGAKKLEDLAKRLTKVTSRGSVAGARILQKEIVSELQSQGIRASGDLIRSVQIKSARSTTATILNPSVAVGSVGSDLDYAATIEDGRRVGAPISEDGFNRIVKWMAIKGLTGGLQGAYMISRKIIRDGIPAKHPFQIARDRAEPKIRTRIEFMVSEILQGTDFEQDLF